MPGSFKHIINFLPLVRTFGACPTFVGVLPLIAVASNEWEQARIILGIGVNTPAIRRRRARLITNNIALFNKRAAIYVMSNIVLAESTADNMRSELVVNTIKQAQKRWHLSEGTIFHSD